MLESRCELFQRCAAIPEAAASRPFGTNFSRADRNATCERSPAIQQSSGLPQPLLSRPSLLLSSLGEWLSFWAPCEQPVYFSLCLADCLPRWIFKQRLATDFYSCSCQALVVTLLRRSICLARSMRPPFWVPCERPYFFLLPC